MLKPNKADGMTVPEATQTSVITTPPVQNNFSPFKLYLSDREQGNRTNILFPKQTQITSLIDLACACVYDHSSNLFKDYHRKNENYIENDVIIQDIDNDFTDDPGKWIYPERLDDYFSLQEVEYSIVPSRNNWKVKEGKEPRPKFHIYFTLRTTLSDPSLFNQICKSIQALFTVDSIQVLDRSLKDPGRQIFGSPDLNPGNDSLIFHPGDKTILDYLKDHKDQIQGIRPDDNYLESNVKDGSSHNTVDLKDFSPIPQGQRHTVLVSVANACLKRYGSTQQAESIFWKHVGRCDPPYTDQADLNRIWTDAKHHYEQTIQNDPEYIRPEDFSDRPKDRNVYLETVEKELQQMNVRIRNNVITGKTEIDRHYLINRGNSQIDSFTVLLVDLLDRFKRQGLKPNKDFVGDCLKVLADKNRYNGFQEWITSAPWDQTDRIESVIDILKIEDTAKRQLVLKWLYQVVFIVLNDDFDPLGNEFVLVLKGKQGIGKTTFFRRLFLPGMLAEGVKIDMDNKDTTLLATSCVCCELGELESTLKKEQADLKNFITRSYDEIRRPYGRQEETKPRPRRTVFCATVNPDAWLRDEEGGRRWVTIELEDIDKIKIGADQEHDPKRENCLLTPQFVQQVWAEIYEMIYLPSMKDHSQPFRLTDSEITETLEENLKYLPDLPGIDELSTVLDWDQPEEDWEYKTATQIKELLGIKASQLSPKHIGSALRRLMKIPEYQQIQFKRSTGKNLFKVPTQTK